MLNKLCKFNVVLSIVLCVSVVLLYFFKNGEVLLDISGVIALIVVLGFFWFFYHVWIPFVARIWKKMRFMNFIKKIPVVKYISARLIALVLFTVMQLGILFIFGYSFYRILLT